MKGRKTKIKNSTFNLLLLLLLISYLFLNWIFMITRTASFLYRVVHTLLLRIIYINITRIFREMKWSWINKKQEGKKTKLTLWSLTYTISVFLHVRIVIKIWSPSVFIRNFTFFFFWYSNYQFSFTLIFSILNNNASINYFTFYLCFSCPLD